MKLFFELLFHIASFSSAHPESCSQIFLTKTEIQSYLYSGTEWLNFLRTKAEDSIFLKRSDGQEFIVN